MMCVPVCEQPVSPGPVPIHREGAQVYTIGGIAFGASDSVSEVRADDEPCDNSANETVTVNSTIEEWLRCNALQDYAEAIKEYGYDSFQALDAASEEQITEMTQDPDVAMKKPHRHLFLREWKKRVQVPRG